MTAEERKDSPVPFAAPTLPPISSPPVTNREDLVLVELGGIKESLRAQTTALQSIAGEVLSVKMTSDQALQTAQRADDAAQRALRAADSAAHEFASFRDATARHIEKVTEPLRVENRAIRDENKTQTEILRTIRESGKAAKYITPLVVTIATLLSAYYGSRGAPQGLMPAPQPTPGLTVLVPAPAPLATPPASAVPLKP